MTEQTPSLKVKKRVAGAALVLATHVVFMQLLLFEGRPRPERHRVAQQLVGIAIQLRPFVPVVSTRSTELPRPPAAEPAPQVVVQTLSPVPAEDATSAASEPPQPVDWYAEAEALARKYEEKPGEPRTFSPAATLMRQPCRPRTRFDKATREKMAEFQSPVSDPIPPGGFRSSSVNMGGVVVRERPLSVGNSGKAGDAEKSKRSFKWKWDYNPTGGSAALTMGWEPNPPYDGMFDDMQAGRTPESSVPHHEDCD